MADGDGPRFGASQRITALDGASRTVPRRTVPLARLQSVSFCGFALRLRPVCSDLYRVDYVMMHRSSLAAEVRRCWDAVVDVMADACLGGRMQ